MTVVSNCYSQDLLTVDWQKVLCNKNSNVYSICKDNDGNTYTLGSLGGPASCLGENLNEYYGDYFFVKQSPNGDKLIIKRFGGSDGYLFGDMKICSNGDIILGVSFTNEFFLNGTLLTTSMKSCDIVLRLDQNFNLRWFKTFPCNNVTYINKLILDSHENMYVSIPFADSITINENVYSHQNRIYGTAIAKINPEGDVEWVHHFNANRTLVNRVLKIYTSCNSCPSTIFVGGSFDGDSIFINGSLKAKNQSKFYSQQFLSILNEYGDVLQTKILDEGIRNIVDIDFYEGRIFFAGSYTDTVECNGTQVVPLDTSSMYIGELNNRGDLIGFKDLNSSNSYNSYLTSFNTSPIYGFVLSGVFDGDFHLQSSSITLGNPFIRGAFITNLNELLELDGIKYITGDNFNLNRLSISKDQIVGAVGFTEICNFQNQNSTYPYAATANFQTTDLKQLNNFHPNPFSTPANFDSLSVQIYPNPFKESFRLKFSEPIYSTSLRVTNSVGQVCKEITVSKINDLEVIIDAKALSQGLYFIQYLTCSNFKGFSRLLKITNP